MPGDGEYRMTTAGRRMVMAAANYWCGPIQTGSHHYARQFAHHNWRVAYISDQISPLHLLRFRSRMYTADKFGLWLRGGRQVMGGRIFAYNHLTMLPVFNAPILRSDFAARFTFDLSVPNLFRVLERQGFERADLLWIDHLLFADLPDYIQADSLVYRMADDPERFSDAYPPTILGRLPRLLKRADLVVTSAQRLYERVRKTRTDGVIYVPNGVVFGDFAAPAGPVPKEYLGLTGPRVVFAGSLEQWFDEQLVAAVARARPDVSFVIIGPARIPLHELRRLPNVHLLGPRPYRTLPDYFAHADVGIIPYRSSAQTDAVNPIKLYEFLAAGLPVVAKRWAELERLCPPVALVDDVAEFVEGIDAALASGDDEVAREERRAFARERSWERRFESVAAALGI